MPRRDDPGRDGETDRLSDEGSESCRALVETLEKQEERASLDLPGTLDGPRRVLAAGDFWLAGCVAGASAVCLLLMLENSRVAHGRQRAGRARASGDAARMVVEWASKWARRGRVNVDDALAAGWLARWLAALLHLLALSSPACVAAECARVRRQDLEPGADGGPKGQAAGSSESALCARARQRARAGRP